MTKYRYGSSAICRSLALGVSVLFFSACDAQAQASPKDVVAAFYKMGLQEYKPQEAFAQYMTPDFVEHAASSPGGTVQATVGFLVELMKQSPRPTWEIVRTIAEGELVFLHVRVTMDKAPPIALGEIFRVQGGKIAEHWDIFQPAAERPINPNSVF